VRRAAKRDNAEPDIIEALRSSGYGVWPVSDEAVPDLLVWRIGCPLFLLLEVKTGTRPLTEAQERFFAVTEGTARFIVRCPEQALAAARAWLGGKLDG